MSIQGIDRLLLLINTLPVTPQLIQQNSVATITTTTTLPAATTTTTNKRTIELISDRSYLRLFSSAKAMRLPSFNLMPSSVTPLFTAVLRVSSPFVIVVEVIVVVTDAAIDLIITTINLNYYHCCSSSS